MNKLQEILLKVAAEDGEDKVRSIMPAEKSPRFWDEPSASRDAVYGALAGLPVGALIDFIYGHDSVADGALTGAGIGALGGGIRGAIGESENAKLRELLKNVDRSREGAEGSIWDDDETIGRMEERRKNILEDLWR